ncbi:7-methylguanosine phosphate-specific 5'-nucleotidase [Desmophyllum pertusum]|uniref:7-methylguanosine phosphate-specific 5'-nucleotidase n=1 Tax=Desmophyllum pertusum TaxID=174260 RepID=A0A9W9ZK87_9CNID|nr:7-methylguanosine phosphate-specific 5'-nucleotidase [Desmophyllum pertusum]
MCPLLPTQAYLKVQEPGTQSLHRQSLPGQAMLLQDLRMKCHHHLPKTRLDVMVGFKDKLLFSHNKKGADKRLPYFDRIQVDERLHNYMDAFDIVIVDDHSIELVDLLLMSIIRA